MVAVPTERSLVVDPRDIGRGLLLLETEVPERERIGACATDGCRWRFCASIITLEQSQPLPVKECLVRDDSEDATHQIPATDKEGKESTSDACL